MKKLIGIVAGLALIGSLSFAACAEAVSVGSEVEGMTTTYDAETGYFTTTVNANVGDQATILAFTGDTLTTDNGTNIEYINQESKGETTSFTYLMKSDVAEGATYTVKIGGSNINTPYSQKITIPTTTQEPTTYTVSGTVANVTANDFITGDLTDYVTEIYGEESLATYIDGYQTKAYLASVEEAENIVAFCIGEATEFTSIKSTDVSFEDGTYSFTDVENGEYVIVLTAKNTLPYAEYVTVEDGNVVMDSVTLYAGDFTATKSGVIDSDDLGALVGTLDIDIESESFDPNYDLVASCVLDSDDLGLLVENLDNDVTVYGTNFGGDNF